MAERSEDRVGQQLGNYRLLRFLGRGGFAEVYLGEHIYLKSHAALKVLHTLLKDQDAEAFLKEAQTLVLLTHPHIVRVLDFAVEDGTPFLVMEYAPQGTLRQRHLKDTPLPTETIVRYVQQVASALQFAHEQRLIHRDVKPENMLLSSRDEVLLSDFGLAMLAPQSLVASTQEMAKPLAGTVLYLAPEQIQGKPRPASDQYALGVLVYEWLCGKPPFRGSFYEIVTQHLWQPPPSLHEQVPALSPAIEEVVLRALAKDPKQRFASVHEFATALQRAAQASISTPTLPPHTQPATIEPAQAYLTVPAVDGQKRSSSAPVSAPPSTPSTGLGREELGDTAQQSLQPEPMGKGLAHVTPLVGRQLEWLRLQAVWQSASTGRPHLLVLSGEAGIGKTRLAEELFGWVTQQDLSAARAACYAVEGELAYAPVGFWLRAEAIRSCWSSLPMLWLTEVARVVPQILVEHPGLPPPSPLTESWQRQQLFEALARAILAARQPLLLLLDDLQWCDQETLAWLHYLLRFDPTARLLIVGTLRAEELTDEHPLQSWLAALRREGQLTQLALEGLSPAETATLASQFAGHDLDPDAATRLYQETEGNALFVVETMRMVHEQDEAREGQAQTEPGGLQAGRVLPAIQAVITARFAKLSPEARELVTLAAVIGRAFSFELLAQASKREEDKLLEELDELWQRRILHEVQGERYDFSHAKIREVAYAELRPPRRRLLHRRIAETLERLSASSLDAFLGDLAYHFFEAGAWEKAVTYGQRAGEQAQAMYAQHAAIEHFTRALDATQRGSIPPPTTLYRLRGQAYETQGDFERARLDYETMLRMTREAGERHAEWQALMDLGFLWAQRDYAQAGNYFQQALALARHMDDPLTLAHSLNRLGNWHANIEQPHQALQYHQEALTLFQQTQDSRGLAETYDLLGMTTTLGGDLLQATTYYQQAVALFQQLDNRQGLTSSLATLMALSEGGGYETETMVSAPTSFAQSLHLGELALQTAREIGQRSAEAYALFALAHYLGPRGEYARALEMAQASLALSQQIEHLQWLTAAHWQVGVLYLDLLALPEAQHHLEQALALAQGVGSWNWMRIVSGFLAQVLILQHDLAKADSILAAALEADAAMQTIGQRLVWAARVELALARSDPGLALDITDRLIASAANMSDEHVIPRLWKLRGEALAALQRTAEAETMLRAAQATAQAQGLRPVLWRICVALGKLYQTQARQEEAEQTFSAARALIEELAANVPDEHIREQFLSQATAMLPHVRSLSPPLEG